MENDIQAHNVVRHKNRMPALIKTSDSMSYLGPFNFRQLLRPVHERGARNIAAPPPAQRKQRQSLITSSKVVA